MMKKSIKYSFLTCTLGYILIIASAVVLSVVVRMITGYYPSITFFMLALITFRLVEVHQAFFIAPPLVATFTMILLSGTSINRNMVAGISMASYYFLVGLVYVIMGAGEFPIEISILWLLWVFVLGFASSIIMNNYIVSRNKIHGAN